MKKNILIILLFLCGLGVGMAQNPVAQKSLTDTSELQSLSQKSLNVPKSFAHWQSKNATDRTTPKHHSVYSQKLGGDIIVQLDKNGNIAEICVPTDSGIPVEFLLQNLSQADLKALKACPNLNYS